MSDLTNYERETIINYNQEEKTAGVYTYNPALIRKLRKIAETRDDIVFKRDTGDMVEVEVPKKWIKVSPPASHSLSDEQRQAAAERLKAAREARVK